MRLFLILLLLLHFPVSYAENISKEILVGSWNPSKHIPSDGATRFRLDVASDLSARMIALNSDKEFILLCMGELLKGDLPLYILKCVGEGRHVMSVVLSGWRLESSGTAMIYGHEYWFGSPGPKDLYGGVPVSYTKSGKT